MGSQENLGRMRQFPDNKSIYSLVLDESRNEVAKVLSFYIKQVCTTLTNYGKAELANNILSHKNINYQDKFGNTALIYFAIRGLSDKIKTIMGIKGIKKNLKNKAGVIAYDIAFSNTNRDIETRKTITTLLQPIKIFPAPKERMI